MVTVLSLSLILISSLIRFNSLCGGKKIFVLQKSFTPMMQLFQILPQLFCYAMEAFHYLK